MEPRRESLSTGPGTWEGPSKHRLSGMEKYWEGEGSDQSLLRERVMTHACFLPTRSQPDHEEVLVKR